MKSVRLRLTDIGRKQARYHCWMQHSSKNTSQSEEKGSAEKHNEDSTRNTKPCSISSPQPRLCIYSECSTCLYSLMPSLLCSHKMIYMPARFQTVQMHLYVLFTRSLAEQTLPRYAVFNQSPFLQVAFTKYCIYVRMAGTKAIHVCKDRVHIQQAYTWRESLPTLQLRGCLLLQTCNALKEEFSKYKSTVRQEPRPCQCTTLCWIISFLPLTAR